MDSSISTLTVSDYDADVPLGSGAGHNVALLGKFDPMKPAGKAVMIPDESMAPLDAVTEKKATMAVNSTLGNRLPLKESP